MDELAPPSKKETERTKKIQKLEKQIISGKTTPKIFEEYKDLTGRGGTLSQKEIDKDPRFKNLTKEQKKGLVVYKIPSMGKLKSGVVSLGGISVAKNKKDDFLGVDLPAEDKKKFEKKEKIKNKNIPKSRLVGKFKRIKKSRGGIINGNDLVASYYEKG